MCNYPNLSGIKAYKIALLHIRVSGIRLTESVKLVFA